MLSVCLTLLLLLSLAPQRVGTAQTQADTPPPADGATTSQAWFRLERTPVAGGAEILTILGSLNGLGGDGGAQEQSPLVSILRDTLGDSDPANDRLRYVWMLTYTRPTVGQRMASAVPFLYWRVGNKKRAGGGPPPHVIDLAATSKDVWQKFFWLALQNIVFNPYGITVKSTTRTFSRNAEEYRKAHILRALAILSLYEHETGAPPAFTPVEMSEIQARLILTEKTFGGIVDDSYLDRVYRNQAIVWRDTRGHNWELLRQRAEAEGLYFEPLLLPDNEPTHALLWVSRDDLLKNPRRTFNGRFLNMANPWGDKRLLRWKGFTETRYFDAENRPVESDAPGARAVEMIPLALYGLDHPKIPAILVDFRDGSNPKGREASRRIIEDVTRNVLAVSRFGDIHYFLGRAVFDFVTSRRGMDINQPARLRAYSQLKLLLSLNASLDPELRDEVSRRLERVSLNPLENDFKAEAQLAKDQYAALLDYARRPDGLPAQIDRDRRTELVPLSHNRAERIFFRIANLLTFGTYMHHEDGPALEQREKIDRRRRLAYHRRFLHEVAKSSPRVEVVWNMDDVRRSLVYLAEHGKDAGARASAAVGRIFEQTNDEETRRLCLSSLYRIDNTTAKNALLRIYQLPGLSPELRLMTAEYLRKAVQEEQRIAPADAKAIIAVIGQ